MLQFLQVRLETDDREKELLLETMRQYNSAVNYVAEKAFNMKISNKYALQKLFYCEIRERFHLNAQLAIRAISKVVEVYKRDKSKQPRFRMNGAIQFDQRNLSWNGMDSISLSTLNGRIKLGTTVGEYQRARMRRLRGQADLICSNHVFYLIAIVEVPEAPEYKSTETLGVDLGIVNLATDSDGEVFSGFEYRKHKTKIFQSKKIIAENSHTKR